MQNKVIYPKYSKPYTVAHTIDFVCSKISNHGLNHGLFFSLFKFFGWKNILNLLENSGLKSRFLFCLIFQFYLMYRLICQKLSHFLSAQMALVSNFFQMIIVLGMYNFDWFLQWNACWIKGEGPHTHFLPTESTQHNLGLSN